MRFRKIAEKTSNCVISVCPLGRMEQLPAQWADFHEILYLSIQRKSFKNIQGSLNSDIETCTIMTIWQYLVEFFLEWELFQIIFVEKVKTNFIFNNFSEKSCHSWDNVEKYGTARHTIDDNITGRIRFACRMTEAIY